MQLLNYCRNAISPFFLSNPFAWSIFYGPRSGLQVSKFIQNSSTLTDTVPSLACLDQDAIMTTVIFKSSFRN